MSAIVGKGGHDAGGGVRRRRAAGMDAAGGGITRRDFVRAGGMAAFGMCMLPCLGSLGGCYDIKEDLRAMYDMGGRLVQTPRVIERVFCTNPIGTYNMYFLARELLVGWNFKPSGASQDYIDVNVLALPSLGVWMGAGATPNSEEIAMQDPDILFCYWTVDETGVKMADDIRDETGFPVMLVDYTIQALPESYRFIGGILGMEERAESVAAFCEQKLAAIREIVDKIPEGERKSVFLAQSTGGLSTDPVGSMHVTDALELIKTTNVADMPGTEGQGMGMPTVNLEQVITWDPDAVLVSEYNMTDYQRSNLYQEILDDHGWNQVSCVASGEVYRIPQMPFTWFGRPPSALRLLGCLWLLKVLYPDHCPDLDVRAEAHEFISRFFEKEPTDADLDAILDGAGIA